MRDISNDCLSTSDDTIIKSIFHNTRFLIYQILIKLFGGVLVCNSQDPPIRTALHFLGTKFSKILLRSTSKCLLGVPYFPSVHTNLTSMVRNTQTQGEYLCLIIDENLFEKHCRLDGLVTTGGVGRACALYHSERKRVRKH